MRLLLLIIYISIVGLHPLRSQITDLPSEMEKVASDSVSTGKFYLIESQSKEPHFPHHTREIKRYSDGRSIVSFSRKPYPELPEKTIIFEISPDWKLAPELKADFPKQKLLLSIRTLDAAKFKASSEIEVTQTYKDYLIIEAGPGDLEELLQHEQIIHIAKYRIPKVETQQSLRDFSVNNINLAQYKFPDLKGNGLGVSVKEFMFDTTDIDIRNRYGLTGLEAEQVDQHANLIASLIAGAGNSGEGARGIAPAATVYSSSFLQLFPDDAENFIQNDILVQNHSYGTSIEAEYGNEAAAYDALVNDVPEMVHVFSSGNSGEEAPDSGPYADFSGYANLTGNFKMAKNILTVGAIDQKKYILSRSSKGPAYDGRIKPEFVAFAPIGTSDAAALVSGTSLLLQQQYQQLHGKLPTAALLKAILMTGAEDVGPKGIDYSSGYGNVDAYKSLEILTEGSYIESSSSANSIEKFTIEVPEGSASLKLALAWNDPAANPGDQLALVNDLNMEVIGPYGTKVEPWILDPRPGHLEDPAVRGKDNLNPAELITLDAPAPGTYTLRISAQALSGGSQEFAVAYTTSVSGRFSFTYPTSSDVILANEPALIRWDTDLSTQASLQVRVNEGEWQMLTGNIDLSSGTYKWDPLEITGKAQLRMNTDTGEYLSNIFPISPVLIPRVEYNCQEDLLLSWDSVPGASGYQVQALGLQYMEAVLTTNETSAILNKNIYPGDTWSVIPLFSELRGPRGTAIDLNLQGTGCYYLNFFAFLDEGPEVNATLNLSTSANIDRVEIKRNNAGEVTVLGEFPFPGPLQLTVTDKSISPGTNLYWAVIFLQDGEQIITNSVELFVPGEDTFEVYPNPIRSGETLSILSKGDEIDFQIYDIQGRIITKEQLLHYNDRIDVNFSSTGIYFVRALREGENIGVAKIIVY